MDAVREQLSRVGWTLEIHTSRSCYGPSPDRALERLVREAPASAWLLSGTIRPMQLWFQRRAVPCLVLGTCPDDIALPFADANHRAACRHAGALFLKKGHRRIALVLPDGATGGDRDSERGLREAIERQHDANLVVLRHRDRTHLCNLLDHSLESSSPPTAYLVARAIHALTVTMHLMRSGVRLPQDAAVLSRDDENFLAHSSPSVSRYSVSNESFARRVSQAVRKLVDNGALPSRAIQLMPRLIVGETLHVPPASNGLR
jgi:DNA-binding LacI/PurR family transcriptional regulator